jgi:hypothetical protein
VGTDINGVVEVAREGGWWQTAMNLGPFVTRNYGLFAALFGVGEEPVPDWAPLAADRGLPPDAHDLTVRWWRWWPAAHAESHVGAGELRRVWGRESFRALLDDRWAAFLTEVLALPRRFADARLVVWFDD